MHCLIVARVLLYVAQVSYHRLSLDAATQVQALTAARCDFCTLAQLHVHDTPHFRVHT